MSTLISQPILSRSEGLSGLINAQRAAGWPEAPPHPWPADSGRLRGCKKTVLCRILCCASSRGSDVRLMALRAFHFSILQWGLSGSSWRLRKDSEFVPLGTEEAPVLLLCIRNVTLPNYKLGSEAPMLLRGKLRGEGLEGRGGG